MTTQSLPNSSKRLWLAAIKPPMYSVAVLPIWVGSAVAWAETQRFHPWIFATFLAAAILIVAWSNVSNDVYDADTGIDQHKAHSLVNLTGNKPLIFWIGNGLLFLGILGILAISWEQHDPTVIGLILLCCALGYSYQGPPFRFGYQGWGELICFICYGPLALSAVYYSQVQSWSLTNLAAAVIVGLTTSLILFCSHFHQVADDLAAGKRSPIVRLGTARGAALLPWVCGSLYGLTLLFVLLGSFPLWTLLVFLSLPFAVQLVRHVQTYHDQPDQVSNCKFIAVALHFCSGMLLGLGFVLG
ncbi:1,4-dihydroxy-2-naphthoate octaprenyltransferase [Neosynechococcus sphagnicola sy1]|uniref:2-carboxy-1,4-naphthoquinone phytyltransferase n=1 Tax=Neosynechococcus sphagnicola sy1 TaxID=1497020 RepID=A0A098TNP9_9CYAN|nr:2-carboxy-1,4-naphthoquinone phytyltransferase [Neosynechococcus sphagnicola]KGF73960.1 1,4-dihydroxy-2-naphthoate octaprenyltransferase [Neosynechococcus sphagnicola sy1]